MAIPGARRWLFWEVDPANVDLAVDADYVIARVLEQGMLADVAWLMRTYGAERLHRFFREGGHPELSARTRGFWRAFFKADEERWMDRSSWRRTSATHWPG